MKEKFLLKDVLFNADKVHTLASEIKVVYADFDQHAFETEVVSAFAELELKARIDHMSDMLFKYLPKNYTEALNIIEKALPEVLDSNKSDDDFGDFIYSPYAAYVASYGCNAKHLEHSLKILRELTKRFSVEFAIRDFINLYPDETLTMMEECALSSHYHERRLASEGLRPKLPWAKKLTLDHKVPIRILDRLFYDKTRYVTRSVANHLNDIAKIDPELVIQTLIRWKASEKQNLKEMAYILSHALRTLVKEGNVESLALLGYKSEPKINISNLSLKQETLRVGETLEFSFQIEAKESCKLLLDYIVYFNTKSGKASKKVHKIKKVSLKSEECINISKKHPFKANMTTRKLYAGEHKVELQINGKCYELGSFMLKV